MSEDRDAERRRLLAAIVPHVAFDGWTHQALKAGFADEGREAWEVRRYFPGGPGDALALFSALSFNDLSSSSSRKIASAPYCSA